MLQPRSKHNNLERRKKIANKLIFNKIDYIIIQAKHKWRLLSAKSHNDMETLFDPKTDILNTKLHQINSKSNSNKKIILEMSN